MDIKSSIRDKVLSQLKKAKSHSIEDRAQAVSFSYLSQKEKRELIALELQGADGWDMLYNTDGPNPLQLLYSVYTKKNLSAEQALNFLMDGLVRRYALNLDEKFSEEFERITEESEANAAMHRSANRSAIPDAPSYL